MKKHLFFFAMLAGITASAQVTNVEPIGANYATKTVSFRVWWSAGSRNATHLSKVWVWVDYITVNSNNTTSGNTWTRATVGTVSGGTTSYDGSNRNGFWLEGNASTNYSATLTVQLTNVPAKFNWCAYVSDYPPNVTFDKGTYTFKGTTTFIVNTHAQPLTSKTIAKADLTVNSSSTFTDATSCPGIGSLYCPYSGSDLYMDATHLCRQRTTGEPNWEAWIKDTRDNEYYRIVLMPDNKWWLAQNLKYAVGGKGVLLQSCGKDSCGRFYTPQEIFGGNYATNQQTICPSGWVFPSKTQWATLTSSISGTLTVAWRDLRSLQTSCTPKTDRYGWATRGRSPMYQVPDDADYYLACTGSAMAYVSVDDSASSFSAICNCAEFWLVEFSSDTRSYAVRCVRP